LINEKLNSKGKSKVRKKARRKSKRVREESILACLWRGEKIIFRERGGGG
jgi:hypothetical protein